MTRGPRERIPSNPSAVIGGPQSSEGRHSDLSGSVGPNPHVLSDLVAGVAQLLWASLEG